MAGVRIGDRFLRLWARGGRSRGESRDRARARIEMAFKKMVERLTKPVDELDREQLSEYCDAHQFEAMDQLVPRRPVRVGGEVRAVRIVPRAGAPALEVTLSDGRGQVVAVFLG